MTDTSAIPNAPAAASLTERTRRVEAGASVVAVAFIKDTAVFVLGEELALLVPEDGEPQRVTMHAGGILCAACDSTRIVTGGDDGQVVALDAGGAVTLLATDDKRRWIDQVALHRDGTVAWSAGKDAFVLPRKGEIRRLAVPSTVGGLAFAPKGLRLAIAHYDGVTLWFPNAKAEPERLGWKGSHVGVSFSPDGRFLVTAMQEPALHGWRVSDSKHMRMTGYAEKVRSMDWSVDGAALATSGASQLVVWPFVGKDGPMGKEPRLLAPFQALVTTVACHPREAVVAAGYDNGMALLIRLEDGAEIVAKAPGGGAMMALAWNRSGSRLAFGTEDGEAGVITV
ncbi:MAG: WD40 repeat domain-containing protein [Xanthobacteraceae bacterium]